MKIFLITAIFLLSIQTIYAHDVCNSTLENNTNMLPEGYCSISLGLQTDKTEYKNQEKITIYNILNDKNYNYTIDYWIEDEEGNTIKEKTSTTNTNNKQYTPKLDQDTTLIIKNNLTKIDCNNTINDTHNEIKVLVGVEENNIPSIKITKLYLNRTKKISIGQNLTAEITVYSRNNTEYEVYYHIKNITEIQNYTITGKYKNTKFNITLPIKYDCNISTNNYKFTVNSEDLEVEEEIVIINNCKINTSESKITDENTTIKQGQNFNTSESVINVLGGTVKGNLVYESSNVKAKNIATYLFMVALAAITMGIILTNKNTDKTIKESTEKWSSQLEQ